MEVTKNIKKRNYGIDIIKIVAVILVICVHFFLNTNYYDTANSGIAMKIQSAIRNFCMICVPLFLIATGFLNNKKEYNKSFFKSLVAIIIIWLFYSVIEFFVLNIINGTTENLNLKNLFFAVTSFKACGYSWYIEMYIGLYLLSPIINNAYNDFNQKNKNTILLLIILITVLPNFINALFNGVFRLPNWWERIYPIAYYIVGKHISCLNPNVNKRVLLILLIFNQLIMMSYYYLAPIEFYSFPVFINSVLVFLLLYNINIKKNRIKSITKYFSSITLDIYLASSLIDKIVYPIFKNVFNFDTIPNQYEIIYAPVIVITIFILSAIYGSVRKLLIKIR